MIPLISILALGACIGSGYLVAVFQFGLNGNYFLEHVFSTMTTADFAAFAAGVKAGEFDDFC
jgi:ABC-type transporter Mla maintaining outer membrane lipid asymmetry permease subunit MlaE